VAERNSITRKNGPPQTDHHPARKAFNGAMKRASPNHRMRL
jgi:hypothetical protein